MLEVRRIIIAALYLPASARALTYSLGQASQCGDLQVTWSEATGGDLNLLVLPEQHGPNNVVQQFKIPSGSASPYTLKNFLLPAGAKYVASLWDEGGYGDTTATGVMTTGSGSSSSCLIPESNPYVDFFFDFNTFTPVQCSTLSITWESNYTAPLEVISITPGGAVRSLYKTSEQGQGGYDWKVDIPSGERFAIAILDAGPLGNGGSSEFLTVGGSGDSGCLARESTTTVIRSSAGGTVLQTITQVVTQPAEAGSTQGSGEGGSKKSGVPIGALVGGIIGGLAAIALLVLLLLWRHRRRQVRDPDHPRQSTWKYYRDTTVFLGGIPGYADRNRDGDERRNRGDNRGRSSPEGYSNQPFLFSDGAPSSSLNKLTPTGQSTLTDDYGFDPSPGLEQDVELSPYLMHDSGFDSPTSPTPMRELGGATHSSRYSTLDRSASPRRLDVRNLDPSDGEESLGPTLPSPLASTARSSPLRLVDSDDRADTTTSSYPARGVSEKARRHSQFMRAQERPTTIVQHSDAGIVEETEGTTAGPEGIIHLPPAYQEVAQTPTTPTQSRPT